MKVAIVILEQGNRSISIIFTLSGKSIHLAGKVYKFFSDLAGKVYTFPSDKERITFLCGKLGKVDKFLGMSLGLHPWDIPWNFLTFPRFPHKNIIYFFVGYLCE